MSQVSNTDYSNNIVIGDIVYSSDLKTVISSKKDITTLNLNFFSSANTLPTTVGFMLSAVAKFEKSNLDLSASVKPNADKSSASEINFSVLVQINRFI